MTLVVDMRRDGPPWVGQGRMKVKATGQFKVATGNCLFSGKSRSEAVKSSRVEKQTLMENWK